jgi:hypothetical protein
MRRYAPIAAGPWFWRARYRRWVQFVRHARRRARKVVWSGERGPLLVGLVLAVVVGFLIAHVSL